MKKLFSFTISFILASTSLMEFSSCMSTKDPCSEEQSKTITRSGIIDEANPGISLSVYDDGGGLVADAACHAQMEIVFQWATPGLSEMPPLNLEFLTVFGYFPRGQIVEIKPGVYKCEVNEAEDKSKPGGTSYGVEATIDKDSWGNGAFPAVKVDMKISYKVYSEDAYTND